MISIPPKVRILATIKAGSVYYFKEEKLSSTEPHFFVVLNKSPKTEAFLVLLCASSQVEKRKARAQKLGFLPETLVFVSPSEYRFFNKETVIDCNAVFEKTTQAVIEKLEHSKLEVCVDMLPEPIVKKLVAGVLASNQVSGLVKQMLSD